MRGLRAMPVLTCADPEGVGAFFTEGLGFRLAGWRREADGTARLGIVGLGGLTVALIRGAAAPPEGWAAYLYVSDARDFAAAAAAAGVALRRGPEDTDYACREVEVATPEGHVLVFAEDLAPSAAGPGL